jgi:hypothetical protein
MKKIIQIKIAGSHTQQYYCGPDAESDFYQAVQNAAKTLDLKRLYYATVSLFNNEDDTYDMAAKRVEIMRQI